MNPTAPETLRIISLALSDLPAARQLLLPGIEASRADEVLLGPGAMVWGAYRGQRLVGGMRIQLQSGKSVTFSPPKLIAGEPHGTSEQLLLQALNALPTADVRVAQTLLEKENPAQHELFQRAEFRHVSNLLYLVSVAGSFPKAPPAPQLQFIPYDPNLEPQNRDLYGRLARVVEQTYQSSLDCPALDGVRDIDDVLAGYRTCDTSSASSNPTAPWFIVQESQADIGCLILTADPHTPQWELTYMGVAADARGHGYGLAITRHAQWLAQEANCRRLVLAVDSKNLPAIASYLAAGFVIWDERCVFVRVF
jgi:mycothiol synthase